MVPSGEYGLCRARITAISQMLAAQNRFFGVVGPEIRPRPLIRNFSVGVLGATSSSSDGVGVGGVVVTWKLSAAARMSGIFQSTDILESRLLRTKEDHCDFADAGGPKQVFWRSRT